MTKILSYNDYTTACKMADATEAELLVAESELWRRKREANNACSFSDAIANAAQAFAEAQEARVQFLKKELAEWIELRDSILDELVENGTL